MNSERSDGDRFFRRMIGYLCVAGSLAGFIGLYFVEVPPGNDKAMMFALGIVFGWGSMVVSSEYGSTATGRKVADSAIRGLDRQNIAAEDKTPSGMSGDPLHTTVDNTRTDPANVTETEK